MNLKAVLIIALVVAFLVGKVIKKTVVIPGKMVIFVVAP